MKTFTDAAGRTWEVAITIGAVKRVKHLLAIDLLAIADGDPPLMTRLATDVVLLCDVLYGLCKPAADAAGLDDAAFGAGLDGQAVIGAMDAFWEALMDFFRCSGQAQKVTALRLNRELTGQMIQQAEAGIRAIPLPTAACGG